jgi:Ca2+-binding RTX toxin-like protein
VELSWKAPGDDWLCGQAQRIEVRVSRDPIDDPSDGNVAKELHANEAAGGVETAQLSPSERGNARHAAVLYRDDAGNWGHLASVELPPLPIPPGHCANGIVGDDNPNTLTGTAGRDQIRGLGGDDLIRGKPKRDCVEGDGDDDELHGGSGPDEYWGDEGDDEFFAVGGNQDAIHCGPGDDRVHAGRNDSVGASCERVTRGS